MMKQLNFQNDLYLSKTSNIEDNLINFDYYKKIKKEKENTKENQKILEDIAHLLKDIPNTYKKIKQKDINVWEIEITTMDGLKKGIVYLLNDNSVVWNFYENNILKNNSEMEKFLVLKKEISIEDKIKNFVKLF